MRLLRRPRAPRGMSLLELMFVLVITGLVVAGITKALIDLDRTARIRNLNVNMQGESRDALQIVERDIRQASLGSTVGEIWTQDTLGNLARRPAVQIFDNVRGGASLDVKPGTDALLVVGGRFNGAQAQAQGTSYDSTQTLTVTQTTDASKTPPVGFAVGDAVLAGPYQAATWGRVTLVTPAGAGTPGGLNLATTQNIYPGGKLDAGALVRAARSRLYYVNTADELVQLELLVPRAPGSVPETSVRNVIARGVENLQIDCELDTGVALAACPAPSAVDPAAGEAVWGFGAWAGGGVRFPTTVPLNVSSLRSVILQLVVRSQALVAGKEGALTEQRGNDPIVVGNQTALLPSGPGVDPTQRYLRRAYRLPVAIRNLSLGAF